MTIEERARDIFEGDEIVWLGPDQARLEKRIAEALRGQIEDCAKVADRKREEWARFVGDDTYTADYQVNAYAKAVTASEIASEIRALADPPTVESRVAAALEGLDEERLEKADGLIKAALMEEVESEGRDGEC